MTDVAPTFKEFTKLRDGMMHAMDGGLWLHRHLWQGRQMAHLVSTNRELLLAYGRAVGLPEHRRAQPVGVVVELGDRLGVPMPSTRAVYACVKLLDEKKRRSA